MQRVQLAGLGEVSLEVCGVDFDLGKVAGISTMPAFVVRRQKGENAKRSLSDVGFREKYAVAYSLIMAQSL